MRSISVSNQAALNARQVLSRDFIWIVARDRETGLPVTVGFWSDLETRTHSVMNPETMTPVSRQYYGAGGLISIDAIPAVSVIQVQDIKITLSQLDEQVEEAIRLYDVQQARIEIHRGLFSPETRKLIDTAMIRFVGFINTVEILTGSENSEGGVTLTCVSHTQELTRANPATRSHENQKLRDPDDDFFIDAAVVGGWEIQWGAARDTKNPEKPKGIFGWNEFLGIF